MHRGVMLWCSPVHVIILRLFCRIVKLRRVASESLHMPPSSMGKRSCFLRGYRFFPLVLRIGCNLSSFLQSCVLSTMMHLRGKAYLQDFCLGVGLAVEVGCFFTLGAVVFASPFAPEFDCFSAVRFKLGSAAATFANHSSSQTLYAAVTLPRCGSMKCRRCDGVADDASMTPA